MITRIGPQVSRAWPCSSWAPRRGGEWNARKCRICRPGSGSCEEGWQREGSPGLPTAARRRAAPASELKRACCSVSNTPFLNTPVSFGHYSSILVTFSAELSRCEWRKSAVGDSATGAIPVPLRESSIPLSLGICLSAKREGTRGRERPLPALQSQSLLEERVGPPSQNCLLKLGVVRI